MRQFTPPMDPYGHRVMRSSPESTTRTTGAHRAHGEARDRTAARTLAQRPPARYEAYLDGLFTYCLSVLGDHDDATAALGDVLALVERRGHRVPESVADHRAWLYALARWACLRRPPAPGRGPSADGPARPGRERRSAGRPAGVPAPRPPSAEERDRRRGELDRLAWPEAAGIGPEQREALELAVRHRLAAHEVAAVLGRDPAATRELLASAACEVERTRAALAVVETGGCPGVARLTGEDRAALCAGLRRELVRHVDDCPRCRGAAARAIPGRWPGTSVSPAELPVLPAPRAALLLAMAHLRRARGAAPRFDRRGFPMDAKDRAARRDRLRARAVTTTVVATVVAAPVLTLWAAYRGTPVGEAEGGRAAVAGEPHGHGGGPAGGHGLADATATRPGGRPGGGDAAGVSVAVVSVSGAGEKGTGRLEVAAGSDGDTTLITLTASGEAPVRWSVSTSAPWLYPNRSSGVLRPGGRVTVRVHVDHLREPTGHWGAKVAVSPAGAVVSIDGHGRVPGPGRPAPGPGRPGASPRPSAPGPGPMPSASAPPGPTPTAEPSSTPPDPGPTSAEPSPTDGPESTPPPPDGEGGDGPDPAGAQARGAAGRRG
nr:hypothetical protein [Streptomyces sp. SHP 1-2]